MPFPLSSSVVLLLLLPLLLPLVSPVELGRRTPPWPHPYWDIPGDYCRFWSDFQIFHWVMSTITCRHTFSNIPGDYCRSPIKSILGGFSILKYELQHITYQLHLDNERDQIDQLVFSGPNTQQWTAVRAGNNIQKKIYSIYHHNFHNFHNGYTMSSQRIWYTSKKYLPCPLPMKQIVLVFNYWLWLFCFDNENVCLQIYLE